MLLSELTIFNWQCFSHWEKCWALLFLVVQNSFNLKIQASGIWICASFQRCLVHITYDDIYCLPLLIRRKGAWIFCVNSFVHQLSYLKVMCSLCNESQGCNHQSWLECPLIFLRDTKENRKRICWKWSNTYSYFDEGHCWKSEFVCITACIRALRPVSCSQGDIAEQEDKSWMAMWPKQRRSIL